MSQRTDPASGNLFVFKDKKKCGFINSNGEVIIKPEFTAAGVFEGKTETRIASEQDIHSEIPRGYRFPRVCDISALSTATSENQKDGFEEYTQENGVLPERFDS